MILQSCQSQRKPAANTEEALYRPNYHFTPKKGWMNDPNGMFYLDGTYHLFYQHYPDNSKWGPMHWGHAMSSDMVVWKHLPVAIYPDESGYIFSGSAVVDYNNTSGFGDGKTPPIIAIYTAHDMMKEKNNQTDVESQSIAYSLDKGETWTKYSGNPVLPNAGIRDFRDPKVFWDEQNSRWVMVLAAQDRIHLYSSKNLKSWAFLSEFGSKTGSHRGVWECPDLFQLPVEGSGEKKWVLFVSINPGGPNGGSATQYFVGDFDGKTFTPDKDFASTHDSRKAVWIDYGKDNYASVSFNNSKGRRIIMGWMSNWEYAENVPTTAWRSANTIPRELTLLKSSGSYELKSKPIAELDKYLSKSVTKTFENISSKDLIDNKEVNLSSSKLKIKLDHLKKGIYQFSLKNDAGEILNFGINNLDKTVYIDRSGSGLTDFSKDFAKNSSVAPLTSALENAELTIFFDKTSAEIFINGGTKVMTEIFFPKSPYTKLFFSGQYPADVSLQANSIKTNKQPGK